MATRRDPPPLPVPARPGAAVHGGVALVAAAALMQQVALVRIFSVVQWHHFAFMAVGVGLLGFGASGTALAVWPALRRAPSATGALAALAVAPSVALALAAIALVPFDAYLLALEPAQAGYLAAQVGALVLPFFFAGLVVGAVLAGAPEASGSLYAASFLGGAAGAAGAVPLLAALGGAGALIASGAAAAAGGGALAWASPRRSLRPLAAVAGLVAVLAAAAALRPPDLPISPYKTLSHVRRFPDARLEFSAEDAVARIDVVRSAALRSAPGLSPTFPAIPPSLPGLTIDGDGLRGLPVPVDAGFTEYLPTAAAYRLRRGRALVVGMGVEVLGALRHGMERVVVLEGTPLVVRAAARFAPGLLGREAPPAAGESRPPTVTAVAEHPRSYLRRSPERFDVIQIPPLESFQVVASGASSLTEHYLYTVEALRDALARLAPDGVLAVTRWIQTPPSEEIRIWAAAVEALERSGASRPERTAPVGATATAAPGAGRPGPPSARLIALRSLNTMTILAAPDGFGAADVEAVRTFAASRRFDITYAPGLGPEWSNRYSVLPVDTHREVFTAILDPQRRAAVLRGYPFDVRPVRDDRPFFFHFFTWGQVPQILATLGRTWQPFGGGGYLILIALLGIVTVLGAGLILAPLRALGRGGLVQGPDGARRPAVLIYFLALGFGYLFIEIPLLQQMILVLGSPVYAAAAVLSAILVASGAGSLLVPRLEPRLLAATAALAVLGAAAAWALPAVVDVALALPPAGRAAAAAVVVLPLGLLMGLPFPAGIRLLGRADPRLIPWAWGINGCASVIGAVLAAILALEWGFRAVLLCGGLAYAVAGAAGRLAAWPRAAR